MVPLKAMSHLGIKSEADIFAVNPVQNTVYESIVSPYRPVSIISEAGPIEICIPASSDYLDISNTMLHLTCKIVKEDDSEFKEIQTDTKVNNVAPINMPAQSLFEKIVVSFNKKVVSSNTNYPYRAIIETLTNFSFDAKNSHFQNQLFFKDTAGKFDAISDENNGYKMRKKLTKNSKEFEMLAPLHIDICNQAKYIINGVEVSFKFYPNTKNNFYMMGEVGSKIKIVDINVITRKVKLHPATIESHAKVLQIENAKYPINRVEIKTYTIGEGLMSKIIDNIYLGPLPNRVIIGLVSTKSFNGDFKCNPYNFQNFNTNEINIMFDNQTIPGLPIQMDYANDKYALAFHTLFSGTGRNFSDSGCFITLEDYKNGNALYCFDLTCDQSSSAQYWSLQKTGNMSIQFKFAKVLPENVTAIIYSEFDNLLEIDKFRNIIIDYPC